MNIDKKLTIFEFINIFIFVIVLIFGTYLLFNLFFVSREKAEILYKETLILKCNILGGQYENNYSWNEYGLCVTEDKRYLFDIENNLWFDSDLLIDNFN